MRLPNATLVAALVLLTAGAARADSFLEVVGGLSMPIGDNAWTNLADASPKLGARIGGVSDTNGLGAMIQADWTPVNLNNSGGAFGVGSLDLAGHDFRFLADLTLHHRVAPKLVVSVRAGVGLELAHASSTLTIVTSTTSASDTNAGFAFEVGGGLWYSLGDVEVGGELALPVAWHSNRNDGSDNGFPFNYTDYNIDVLIGVRVLSR